jgi:hypothetical protein
MEVLNMNDYVVVRSSIDHMWRVMKKADAPHGICYSVADEMDDAIMDGASFLGISPENVDVY